MAEQRPTAFRFRLPWIKPSAPVAQPTTAPDPPVQPPRTTPQTPAAPTPAPRPPFRPPGSAPVPTAPTPSLPAPRVALEPTAPTPSPPVPRVTSPPVPQPPAITRLPVTQVAPQVSAAQLPSGAAPLLPPSTITSPPASAAPVTSETPPPPPPPPSPPPPVQSSSTAESKPATAKALDAPGMQPTKETQSTTEPSGPPTPPQRSPPRPPKPAQAQPSPSQVPAPAKTESQPSSPSRANNQSRVTLQPASPSRTTTQPRAASKLPSPSRGATQSRASSQLSPPGRVQPSQTATPPRSPSQSASQSADKKSSPSSPVMMQPKGGPVSQLAQPPSPEPIQNTVEVSSKGGPVSQLGQPPSPEPIQNTVEASLSFESIEPQPKTESKAGTKQSRTNEERNPTVSDYIPQGADIAPNSEPKSIKEVEEEKNRSIEANEDRNQTNSEARPKEKRRVAVNVEQKQPEKQPEKQQEVLGRKERLTARTVPGIAQTKTVISHLLDKVPVSESPQKPTPITGSQTSLQKEIKDDISRFIHKMATTPSKQSMDGKPVSVVTLTGDNRGALMHLCSEANKREGPIHIHRGYMLNPDESADTTDGEGSSNERKSKKDSDAEQNKEAKAYVNSNVQGINNSIFFNSSVTERNPGVHLGFAHNLANGVKSKEKRTESVETRRAEVNITPSEKLTYEPNIRRRCLRGLFMEPSDSDPDDPEKPRRHGCRYSCGETSNKDNEIDVL